VIRNSSVTTGLASLPMQARTFKTALRQMRRASVMCERNPHLPPRFPKAQPAKGDPETQKTGTLAIPPDRSSRSFEPAACLSEQPKSVSARRSPPAPAALEYYINRLPGKCRARRLFQPPGCRASVPCDRPGDRRCGTCRLEEKTPRSCSSSRGSPSQPFPPSFGPKSEKRSAPGSFRYRAVPRASTILHPRPFRKYPPELASRSRRLGSGGSSSLPNQSQSTHPDFKTL